MSAHATNLTNQTLAVIMGGGQGTRLFPLTRERAKPAVPLAGKYRLVDIPISNCINSGVLRMYLLTQFNSASLHRHVSQSYKFDHFSNGFVEVLAAEQSFSSTSWYQGTADAVRKNLLHFQNNSFEYALILSGDQLYRMDFRRIIEAHANASADITVACLPVDEQCAPALGIMQINRERRVVRFVEKPQEPALLDSLRLGPEARARLDIDSSEPRFLASMGIYVFNREVLFELLQNNLTDFGKHIIPSAIETHRVFGHVFQGYWEDIGTIRNFFEANLDQASDLPKFNFFDPPVFTRPRFLPPSKINGGAVDHAVLADGCIVNNARLRHSVVGIRSILSDGASLERVVMLGADYYDSAQRANRPENGGVPLGIGRDTHIDNTIVDKNARIGEGCWLSPAGQPESVDHPLYYIRDGVLVVPKGGVVPNGFRVGA